MQQLPYTYDGTSIQDSSYAAYLPDVLMPTSATPVWVERQATFPRLGYKAKTPRLMELRIKLLGTIHSQLQSLKTLFDPYDNSDDGYGPGAHQFIVTDTADSNKQWYVYATTLSYPRRDGQEVSIILGIADPVWQTVTQTTNTKSVTASGDTKDVAVAGNQPAKPVLKITPTAAKASTGSNPYKRYIKVYNKAFYGVSSVNSALPFTNYPIDITAGGFDSTALVNDTTVSNQINQGGGIDAVVTTIPIDTAVGGGLAASGMGYCGTEQISWTANSGSSLTGVTRGIGGTTAATHADNAVIARSKALANGADVQVMVDGSTVDYWFGSSTHAWNAAATQIWANINLQASGQAAKAVLATAIAGSGAVTTITLGPRINPLFWPFGSGDIGGAPKWPTAGQVLIGSEIFGYTSQDPANFNLIGTTRSILGTSNAAHAVGDQVYLLDHEIYLIYGDPAATARTMDDTRKPMISLATSTNTSWVWTEFYSSAGGRTGQWLPVVAASDAPANVRTTKTYTTTEDTATVTDPAAVMGDAIASWLSGSSWKADNGSVEWYINHPAGFTTVTITGRKFRTSANTSWPTTAGLWKQPIGVSATAVWTEAAPSAGSWADLTAHSAISLSGTVTYLRWRFFGVQAAKANAYCAMEAKDATFVVDSARTPSVTLGSEIGPAAGYPLSAKITNGTSGEWLRIDFQMDINEQVVIDCENKTVTYTKDGSPAPCKLTFSSQREAWLDLAPGTTTLTYTDVGTTGATWLILTRDRAS